MRCITEKRHAPGRRITGLFLSLLLILLLSGSYGGMAYAGEEEPSLSAEEAEFAAFSRVPYLPEMLRPALYTTTENLCVVGEDIDLEGYVPEGVSGAIGLFDIEKGTTLKAWQLFEQIYPASTTKIMSALIVLENCKELDEIVTVGEVINSIEPGSSSAGLKVGDQVSVRDLLYGMVLPSGNDAAVVLAEHVAGSVNAFVDLMNKKAAQLMATGTHFANPHGLQDENHYTTAYDLYLIFRECLSIEYFRTIIDTPSYTGEVTHEDGSVTMATWDATNYYFAGLADAPAGFTILGGKTGTTDEAGCCLILYVKDAAQEPYIAIIMHAGDKHILYREMNDMLSHIPVDAM